MTGILIVVILMGGVSVARALFGQKRIRPAPSPDYLPERARTSTAQTRPLQIKWDSAADDDDQDEVVEAVSAEPAPAAAEIRPPAIKGSGVAMYLLDARQPDRSADRTAELIDMMTGPGICTPRSR